MTSISGIPIQQPIGDNSIAKVSNRPKKYKVKNKNTLTMEQMGRDERFKSIKSEFETNPRTKFVFRSLSDEEKELFTSEYFSVIKSTESLTEAENLNLFAAILEFVLAMRALDFKSIEERLYAESVRGQIKQFIIEDGKKIINPNYKLSIDSRYEEEYSTHLNNYNKMLDSLKMSRKQRLDKVKQEKRTLVDVAMELSSHDAQAAAADEIERLSKESDEAIKDMLQKGYLLGEFLND